MKRRLLILLRIAVFLALGSSETFAHHSFASVYIVGKTAKIEGTVKEFIWRNPHSFIKVEAPDEKGVMQIYVLEWGAPTQLAESHLTRNVLRSGDHVIASGHPGRVAEDHRMQVSSIERPSDGWKWQGVVD